MPVDAIIFDFDGTVVDTETPDFTAWKEVYAAHGVTLELDLWKQRVGLALNSPDMFNPEAYLTRLTGKALEDEELRRHYKNYMALCEQQPLLPGVMELIHYAVSKNIKLGVASNSDRGWIVRWMHFYRLESYFKCVFTRDDVENPKPHPELYLRTAECLGVDASRCIAIEDSPTGMRAVIAAGMRCIAVPNYLTAHLERPPVALELRSLAELTPEALLARF